MINPDLFVSTAITAHSEGRFLRSAIESVFRNIEVLKNSYGCEAEVLLILDSPTDETLAIATEFGSEVTISEVNFRDVSKARNLASQLASGKHLAFLDGDDIWSWNWLKNCYDFVLRLGAGEKFLLHPELNYFFGDHSGQALTLFEHVSSEDKRFDVFDLATSNFWTALAFGPVEVFRETPYVSSSIHNSIGFEDWTFNIQAIEAGVKHLVVPETVHYLREKPSGSRRKEESRHGLFHAPSRLWMSDELTSKPRVARNI